MKFQKLTPEMNTLYGLYFEEDPDNVNLNNKAILYDCNEDRRASPNKGSPKIFSSLIRYDES